MDTPARGPPSEPAASADWRRLLEAQLAAAERVVEIGRQMAQRLDGDAAGSVRPVVALSPAAVGGGAGMCRPQERSDSDSLAEPLLRRGATKSLSNGIRTRTGHFQVLDDEAKQSAGLGVFPDIDQVKERVKAALATSEYNAEDYYWNCGACQKLARSERFKRLVVVVIVLNALWIGVDTDWNAAPALYYAAPVFQVIENVFCTFFAFEIVVRFLAFRFKRDACRDGGFLFDAALVALMVWETWLETILLALGVLGSVAFGHSGAGSMARLARLLRLLRVLRMGRLLKEMPEFMFLAKGLAIAARSVFSTLLLLIGIVYVFAIIFVQLLAFTPAASGCFETVPSAANCLLVNAALADQKDALDTILDQSWIAYFAALFYFALGSLTLMNMLVGSLVQVVSVVAQEQSELTRVEACKKKMTSILLELDANHDLHVSRDEFVQIMTNPDMVRTLAELEVDVEALLDYADVVFDGHEQFDLAQFVEAVLQFRSSNSATVKDLAHIRRVIGREVGALRAGIGLAGGAAGAGGPGGAAAGAGGPGGAPPGGR